MGWKSQIQLVDTGGIHTDDSEGELPLQVCATACIRYFPVKSWQPLFTGSPLQTEQEFTDRAPNASTARTTDKVGTVFKRKKENELDLSLPWTQNSAVTQRERALRPEW